MFISLKKTDEQNKTIVNLLKCENILKSFYNISNDSSLYIFKAEFNVDGMNIPKIEYEIYYPLFDVDLIKLNLTECRNANIDISLNVNISDNIEKHNLSSDYYNDICSKTTSESNTDISLENRKNKFFEDNMTLCEEDCSLIDYNYTIKKAKCSCLIKISIPFIDDIIFDKKKLIENIMDIKNIANMKLLRCYKSVFALKNLKKNYGFLIHLFIYILFFICLILFYFRCYIKIKNEINNIVKAKSQTLRNKNIKNTGIENRNNINKKSIIFDQQKKSIKDGYKYRKKPKKNSHIKPITISFPPRKNSRQLNTNNKISQNISSMKNMGITNNNINAPTIKKNKSKKKLNCKSILEYNDNELNSLIYKKALLYDKRVYSQYYFSLLKTGHLFIFSFYSNNKDYNPQIIKLFLFFFFFDVYLTINVLFFNQNKLHQIYEDKGEFNLIYQIPQILCSTIISSVINSLIKFLALENNNIVVLKNAKTKDDLITKEKNIYKKIKLKFCLFFIIVFILLFLFMLYVSCFCGIYVNTQIHLIKDTIISFSLSLIYPFGILLIPGIFRISALKAKKKDKKYLYKFSQFLQDFTKF